jgi:pantoate--beta-alanine ligase
MPTIVKTPRALRQAADALRASGERVGLVPTMGALHEGHMSLVAAARAAGATRVVLSIFVNPLQFAAHEDLSKYPRTFADDLARCGAHGVDLIYAPETRDMYPDGFETHVEVERVTRDLEGAARPTHFRGVTTVVTKLFNAAGPCIAAFGRKDYQQWRAIVSLVRDLDMPIEVLGCPILREPDGLAQSSRNRYLTPDERARATAIYAGLCAASGAYRAGERGVKPLVALATAPIAAAFDGIDYVSIVDADNLAEQPDASSGNAQMLIAARLGRTRLIDNARLGQECVVQ